MLEFYYIFSQKFCNADKYEELEIDTDSLYLGLSEDNLQDVILLEKRGLECDAIGRLHRHFHCQRNRQFFSQNVLQHTKETQ